jgi:hypothetical protein
MGLNHITLRQAMDWHSDLTGPTAGTTEVGILGVVALAPEPGDHGWSHGTVKLNGWQDMLCIYIIIYILILYIYVNIIYIY